MRLQQTQDLFEDPGWYEAGGWTHLCLLELKFQFLVNLILVLTAQQSLYFCKIWMLFFSYLGFKLVPLFRIIGRYKRPIFTIVIKILTWIVSTILICVFILPFCNSLLFQPVVQSAALKANGAVLHFQALSVWHGEYTGRREHRDDLISELMLLYCLITAWGRFLTKLYCFYYTGKRWSGNWLCLAGGEWISGLAAQMHISYLLNRLSIVLL